MEEFAERQQSGTLDRMMRNLGILLVILGLIVACYVAFNTYTIFTEPHRLTVFQRLITDRIEATTEPTEKTGETRLVIPPELLSYAIPIALLAIGVSISGVLIGGGAKLLNGNFQQVSRRLSALKQKFEDFRTGPPGCL